MKTNLLILVISAITLASVYSQFLQAATNEPLIGGLEDVLRLQNRESLIKMAIACEKYDLKKRSIGESLGGLHDYIWRLQDPDIIKIVFDYAAQYSELNSLTKLKELAQIVEPPQPTTVDVYLTNLPRMNLIETALACESFIREKKQSKLLGGLHDYIDSLDNKEIVKIVNSFITENPELTMDKLKELTKKKVLSQDEFEAYLDGLVKDEKDLTNLVQAALSVDSYDLEHSMYKRMGGLHDFAHLLTKKQLVDATVAIAKRWPELYEEGKLSQIMGRQKVRLQGATFGGIEDYLFKMNLEDLKNMALAGESYDRTQRKVILLGGLHDYIDSLSKDQVYEIIMNYVRQYPELRRSGFLESLAGIPDKGFESLLQNYDLPKLKKTALSLEAYDRDVRKIRLMGGLHDYIDTLTAENLIEYIRRKGEAYPEIRNEEKLNSIVSKYSS